jgi:hypothetical protein
LLLWRNDGPRFFLREDECSQSREHKNRAENTYSDCESAFPACFAFHRPSLPQDPPSTPDVTCANHIAVLTRRYDRG